MPPERAVRLLRAKAGELEGFVRGAHEAPVGHTPNYSSIDAAADIALIASLLADHIERTT